MFELVAPGADLEAAAARLDVTGYEARDLYPDALPCLRELRGRGLAVGVCGNQPEATEAFLRELGVPLDLVGSSARWGVEKPDPAFYARIAAELGAAAGRDRARRRPRRQRRRAGARRRAWSRSTCGAGRGACCRRAGPRRRRRTWRSTGSPALPDALDAIGRR